MVNFSRYRLLIFSPNPDKLMKFYRDVLGLKVTQKMDIPNDYGYGVRVNKDYIIWIGKHDQVKGKSQEPFRTMHNLYPKQGVTHWYNKIKDHQDVTIVLKPELTPFATKDNPVYVCTWLDPENNCWQFMGKK